MQTDGSTTADVTDRARMRRRWIYVAAALVVAVLAWFVWHRLHSHDDTAPGGRRFARTGPMPVSVAKASQKSFDIYVNGLGTVTPLEVVTVRSRVDGELMKVAFKEGDLVKEGDLLAQIDPRAFEVQLMQAKGQYARDEALLKNAQVDLERYRTLLAQDSTSKQQVDTQDALVGQYKAALQSDQAQVKNAELQLSYAKITAPISGRLGLRQVDRGNQIHAGDTNGLVVITKLNPISVLFTVPEDQLTMLLRQRRANEVAPVEAWDRANKNKLASGTLATFDNQVDPTTGTVKLRANFDNSAGILFPNQFVNIKLLVSKLADATVVPVSAIQHGQPGTFVYVVNADNSVKVQVVEPGPTQDDQVAINKGIEPGTTVVIDGADKLREGAKVEPIVAGQAPAAGQPRMGKDGKPFDRSKLDPNRKHKRDAASGSSSS